MTKDEFIEEYKDLFKDKWAYPECGNGWLPLIDNLCRMIKRKSDVIIEHNVGWMKNEVISSEDYEANKKFIEDFKIVQIKEKFGGLRFYVEGATPEIKGWIQFAETMSFEVCEVCGTNQELGMTTGWMRTMCRPCAIVLDKGDVWMSKEERKQLMGDVFKKKNKE